MLTPVEHEHDVLIADVRDDFRERRSRFSGRCPADLVDDAVRIRYRRQIDERTEVDVVEALIRDRLQREAGLAATSGADERDQAMRLDRFVDLRNRVPAPDE